VYVFRTTGTNRRPEYEAIYDGCRKRGINRENGDQSGSKTTISKKIAMRSGTLYIIFEETNENERQFDTIYARERPFWVAGDWRRAKGKVKINEAAAGEFTSWTG